MAAGDRRRRKGEWGGLWLQTDVPSVLRVAVWTRHDKWMSLMVTHCYIPLFISLSLSHRPPPPLVFTLEGGCISSNGRRTTHQNPWCHPAASSTALQVRVEAHCPPLAGLRTARLQMCIHINLMGVCMCVAVICFFCWHTPVNWGEKLCLLIGKKLILRSVVMVGLG